MHNILFVTTRLEEGGAERVMTHYINSLDRSRFNVHLLLLADSKHSFLSDIKENITIHYMGLKSSVRYKGPQIFLKIMSISCDTIFVGLGELNILLAPFIPFSRNRTWVARETNYLSSRYGNSFKGRLAKLFYNNYNTIISQNNLMAEDLKNNYNVNSDKLVVINNPIDCSVIDHKSSCKEYNYGYDRYFSNSKINIVLCGRLTKQKGFDLFLEQFNNISKKERFNIVIIGNENDKDKEKNKELLEDYILEHELAKYIQIVPFQNNIHTWLKNADFFILSSRYEGFPNILLEALYCGLPSLANIEANGVSEIIRESMNGYTFNYSDSNFEDKLNILVSAKFDRQEISDDIKRRFDLKNCQKIIEDAICY